MYPRAGLNRCGNCRPSAPGSDPRTVQPVSKIIILIILIIIINVNLQLSLCLEAVWTVSDQGQCALEFVADKWHKEGIISEYFWFSSVHTLVICVRYSSITSPK